MLAQFMQRLCQLGALLLNLSCRLYYLLVKNLIAVCEIGHARAEYHRVLVHVDADLPLGGHQLNYRLAIFLFFEDFIGFLKLFEVLNFQKIDETYGTFQFF